MSTERFVHEEIRVKIEDTLEELSNLDLDNDKDAESRFGYWVESLIYFLEEKLTELK